PVTVRLFNLPAPVALAEMFNSASAYGYRVHCYWNDGAVRVTLESPTPERPELRMYDVAALIGHFGTTQVAQQYGDLFPVEHVLDNVVAADALPPMIEFKGRLLVSSGATTQTLVERVLRNLQRAQRELDRRA